MIVSSTLRLAVIVAPIVHYQGRQAWCFTLSPIPFRADTRRYDVAVLVPILPDNTISTDRMWIVPWGTIRSTTVVVAVRRTRRRQLDQFVNAWRLVRECQSSIT